MAAAGAAAAAAAEAAAAVAAAEAAGAAAAAAVAAAAGAAAAAAAAGAAAAVAAPGAAATLAWVSGWRLGRSSFAGLKWRRWRRDTHTLTHSLSHSPRAPGTGEEGGGERERAGTDRGTGGPGAGVSPRVREEAGGTAGARARPVGQAWRTGKAEAAGRGGREGRRQKDGPGERKKERASVRLGSPRRSAAASAAEQTSRARRLPSGVSGGGGSGRAIPERESGAGARGGRRAPPFLFLPPHPLKERPARNFLFLRPLLSSAPPPSAKGK